MACRVLASGSMSRFPDMATLLAITAEASTMAECENLRAAVDLSSFSAPNI
jgi:hypothetical protein